MKTNLAGLGLLAWCSSGCLIPNPGPPGAETDSPASTGSDATGSATGTSASTGDATSVDPDDGSESSAGPSSGETTTGGSCTDAVDCEGSLCIDGSCAACSRAEDPDAACAAAFDDLPYCDPVTGSCVPCTAESACPESTPVCDPDVGCVPCTEHDQCSESACHLGGPDEGRCFDIADVVDVESPAALADHFADIGPGEQRVLRLQSEAYDVSFFPLEAGREIAFLGTAGTILDGSLTLGQNGGGSEAYIYFSSVEFSSDDLMFLVQNRDTELWFDDSTYTSAMSLGGEAHLRRSGLWADAPTPLGEGVLFTGSESSVFIENTGIGPSAYPGLSLSGEIDIRYSTIAGVSTAVACNGAPAGTIRNSIVLGTADPAIDAECDGLTWSNNAVNESGFGTQVGAYEPTWFVTSAASRLLLSNQAETVFADIAEWEPGDPERDIEGDLRPQDGPGFPGVDEP